MLQREQRFVEANTIPWEYAGIGLKRQLLTYDSSLMMVKVVFDEGGLGTLHSHSHIQMSYVERGKFNVQIGNEKRLLQAGDAYYVPANVVHGAVCLEAGVLVDVFCPFSQHE